MKMGAIEVDHIAIEVPLEAVAEEQGHLLCDLRRDLPHAIEDGDDMRSIRTLRRRVEVAARQLVLKRSERRRMTRRIRERE